MTEVLLLRFYFGKLDNGLMLNTNTTNKIKVKCLKVGNNNITILFHLEINSCLMHPP